MAVDDFVHPRLLNAFAAVSEELHVGRAARRLFIAPSTLASQIRELERLLGVRLIIGQTGVVRLTPGGEQLVAATRQELAGHNEFVGQARAIAGRVDVIRLGFLAGAFELVAPVTEHFKQTAGPDLNVSTLTLEDGVRQLQRGLLDAMYTSALGAVVVDGLEWRHIADDQVMAYVRPGHPLAVHDEVPVMAGLEYELVVGKGFERLFSTQVDLLFHDRPGHKPNIVAVDTALHAANIVLAGDSVLVGSDRLFEWIERLGVVRRPLAPKVSLSLGLIIRQDTTSPLRTHLDMIANLIGTLLEAS